MRGQGRDYGPFLGGAGGIGGRTVGAGGLMFACLCDGAGLGGDCGAGGLLMTVPLVVLQIRPKIHPWHQPECLPDAQGLDPRRPQS